MPVANLVGDGEVQVQRLDRGQDSPAPGSWRIGPEPEAASVDLRDQVRRDVAGAFGVSPGLVIAETGSAQSTRELRSLCGFGAGCCRCCPRWRPSYARVLDSPVAFRLPMIDDERAEAESRRQQRRAMAIGNLMARGLTQDAATSVYDAG